MRWTPSSGWIVPRCRSGLVATTCFHIQFLTKLSRKFNILLNPACCDGRLTKFPLFRRLLPCRDRLPRDSDTPPDLAKRLRPWRSFGGISWGSCGGSGRNLEWKRQFVMFLASNITLVFTLLRASRALRFHDRRWCIHCCGVLFLSTLNPIMFWIPWLLKKWI